MKKLTKHIILLMILVAGSSIGSKLYASHAAGLELAYTKLPGNPGQELYQFTVTFYRNCNGIAAPPSFPLRARSNSLGVNNTNAVSLTQVGCQFPDNLLNCTDATFLCYQECVYRGTLDLASLSPTPNATDWEFAVQECCRPGAVAARPDNITPGWQWVEAGLNNVDFPLGNNSPYWHNSMPIAPTQPTINFLFRTMCEGNFYTFDQSVVQPDAGDTVIYSFIQPFDINGTAATYIGGYSLANPFPFAATPGFNINANGIIDVIPTAPTNPADNIYVITIKATEMRKKNVVVNGVITPIFKEIGFVTRDLTLYVDPPATCKFDSAHPWPTGVTCGADSMVVKFRSKPNDWSRVRCASISADGSEFRILDSSFTPPRPISVLSANWVCGSGQNTGSVTLRLAEKLHYDNDYYLFLKKGTDLDVLESECGFLEPEFSGTKINIIGTTPVSLNVPPRLTICLPQENPFPIIKDTINSAFEYAWTLDDDTIPGMDLDSIWADKPGEYKILVKGEYGCPGSDAVTIYFPEYPEFTVDFPPYCDTTLKPNENLLPPFLTVPSEPTGGTWHWEYDFGPPNGFDQVHTGDSVPLIGAGTYKLVYTDTNIAPGVAGCIAEQVFDFNRSTHPPEAPLNVNILGDPVLCETGGGSAVLYIEDDQLKPNFKAKPGFPTNLPYRYQWFEGSLANPIPSANDTSIIRSDEGTYYLYVKDDYGCVGIDSVVIKRIARAQAFEVFCEVLGGKTGRFSWGPVPDAYAYEVSADNGITWVTVPQTFFDVEDIRVTNRVQVRALLNNVCEVSETGTSYDCAANVFPPNVFTPNGDGLNDVFFVGSLDLFPESGVKIFDRWGTVVFESDNYENNWDGGDVPEGTYYYIVNVNDPASSVYKGVITLLR